MIIICHLSVEDSSTVCGKHMINTYQYSSGGGLAGDEFAGPVLGLGHEGAFELLFPLSGRLLLLLLGVVGRELRLLAAANERARAP